MPGLLENRRKWSEHNWEHGGHRWSPGGTRGGTDMMWARSIRPRIHTYLPAGTLLEIAPGYGRWTEYLLEDCRRVIGVDITESCVDVCRERFASHAAEFFVNDGESLGMLADGSVDFAFSFDSLVHVEAPQLREYLRELARTLKPGGAAFLHHSNLGAYVDSRTGTVPAWVRERHWRAQSVSARLFRQFCAEAGLRCLTQEVINWIGRDVDVDRHRLPGSQVPLTDCLSLCVRDTSARDGSSVYVNRRFVDEWRELIDLTMLYANGGDTAVPSRGPSSGPAARTSVHPRSGAARVRQTASRTRHRLQGLGFVLREPIVRALRSGRCPDCGEPAARRGAGLACTRCEAHFTWR